MLCIHVFRKILKMSSHNVPLVRPMETRYVLCQIQQTESLQYTSRKARRIQQEIIFLFLIFHLFPSTSLSPSCL
jgi:hypothetical protein